MSLFRYLVLVAVVLGIVPAIQAEVRCPGNVASIRPRFVDHSIVIVPVMVNDSGPYDFVLDTAAQVTAIDPSLAEELHFKVEGTAGVTGAGFSTRARYAQPRILRTGVNLVRNPLVLVYPLGQIHISDGRVRGILGENFLEQFDLLIDYDRAIVCMDDAGMLREKMKGEHLDLVTPPGFEQHLPHMEPPILRVDVASTSGRSLLLELDSGINAPLLFDASVLASPQGVTKPLQSQGTDGTSHEYEVLVAQDIAVGPHRFKQVAFVAPAMEGEKEPHQGTDGVLPTGLFRRVFICYAGRFAVLVPW